MSEASFSSLAIYRRWSSGSSELESGWHALDGEGASDEVADQLSPLMFGHVLPHLAVGAQHWQAAVPWPPSDVGWWISSNSLFTRSLGDLS